MTYTKRLIEGNFPCEQVGAETRRERGSSSSLPPLFFLHIWWARRPLIPSRAAILSSVLSNTFSNYDFVKSLGMVKKQALIGGKVWNIVDKNLNLITIKDNKEILVRTPQLESALKLESERRNRVYAELKLICDKEPFLRNNQTIINWMTENEPFDFSSWDEILEAANCINVVSVGANPAEINERIAIKNSGIFQEILGHAFSISPEDMYGYDRAYKNNSEIKLNGMVVLDPTSGGGSIPFEAVRLGCNVISNDLNPVATAIQKATIEYPLCFGHNLEEHINKYGEIFVQKVSEKLVDFYPTYENEIVNDYLYHKTVTCPHCGERTPLINSFCLQAKSDGWMVVPEISHTGNNKKLKLRPVRLKKGKGPHGENPEGGSVKLGVGSCMLCGQSIDNEEIKKQCCGESEYGYCTEDLFCVVVDKLVNKLDKDGNIVRFKSGIHKRENRKEWVLSFREPTPEELKIEKEMSNVLKSKWKEWENKDLIPIEKIQVGYNTLQPISYGMKYWHEMFMPRQLVSHITALETLKELQSKIYKEIGTEKGKAVLHYLLYMLDKCLDYSSKQSVWHSGRSVVGHTFTNHNFGPKWMVAEMPYVGENGGLEWGKGQITDCYKALCNLLSGSKGSLKILNSSAANLDLSDESVDVICLDPPYYNNVQYAELSDFFYVWEKRILGEIFPEWFSRRLTNKNDEAVANPVRHGGTKGSELEYENRMEEIFKECYRLLKKDGIMTVMFTHKTQEAWQTLTLALIKSGWQISSAFPVDSEGNNSITQRDVAAASSSIFLACRKKEFVNHEPSVWQGFGGTGVLPKLRKAVKESLKNFEILNLNSVDEMVASYGSALKVLSENWPVMDGDEMVTPIRAMREASTIVAQYQLSKLTDGSIGIEDVTPEAGMTLTLFGIYGTGWFPFDDVRNIANSLNIKLITKNAGYIGEGRMTGINDEVSSRSGKGKNFEGYFAPIVKKNSKLRLVMPEERNEKRLKDPQSEWDILQGTIMAYREGDIPVARAYLNRNAVGKEDKIIGILKVWADGCGNEELKKEAQRIIFGLR